MGLICDHIPMGVQCRNASVRGLQYKESQMVKNNLEPSCCLATLNPTK